jgi:hypothetical protein
MSFYGEISPFIDFIHSVRKLKNYLSFDVKFPDKWIIPKSILEDTQLVTFEVDDPTLKGISFVCEIKDENINIVLNKINKIIKINREKELKEKLFRQMVDKLKVTFDSNNLEVLQNLYFDFQKDEPNLEFEDEESIRKTDVELVGEGDEERRIGAEPVQNENSKRNKKNREREYVSET